MADVDVVNSVVRDAREGNVETVVPMISNRVLLYKLIAELHKDENRNAIRARGNQTALVERLDRVVARRDVLFDHERAEAQQELGRLRAAYEIGTVAPTGVPPETPAPAPTATPGGGPEAAPTAPAPQPPGNPNLVERGATEFWQLVKDNPGTTASVVGGVVVTGALVLWLTRASNGIRNAGRVVLAGALGGLAVLGIPWAYRKYHELHDTIEAAKREVAEAKAKVEQVADAVERRVKQLEDQMAALGKRIDAVKLGTAIRRWDSVTTTLQRRPRDSRAPTQQFGLLEGEINALIAPAVMDDDTRNTFLKEARLINDAGAATPVLVIGTPATTRYEVTYDAVQKKIAIKDVSEREVLPANVNESTQQGLLAAARENRPNTEDLPPAERPLVKADIVPMTITGANIGDLMASSTPSFRTITLKDLLTAVGAGADVPFATASTRPPLNQFTANSERLMTAYYVAITLKRIHTRDLETRVPNAENLTVEQIIDRRGMYLRTKFRFNAASLMPEAREGFRDNTGRAIGVVLNNTFSPRFLEEDGQSLAVQQALASLQLGRAETSFMRYVSNNPDIKLEGLNPATLPSTGNSDIDADLRLAVPRLQAIMLSADVKRTLGMFLKMDDIKNRVKEDLLERNPAATPGDQDAAANAVPGRINDVIANMKLGDAVQLMLFLEDVKWQGRLPANEGEAGETGPEMIVLKLCHMVGRTDPALARSILRPNRRP